MKEILSALLLIASVTALMAVWLWGGDGIVPVLDEGGADISRSIESINP